MNSERVFSGIQPSGEIHIGNYLGAVKRWVELCDDHDAIYCVVDDHAITVEYDPSRLPAMTFDASLTTMACGLDPEKCTIFVQSHVPEHTELTWLFSTVTPLGSLFRMTQFKDKARNALQRKLTRKEGGAMKTAIHNLKTLGSEALEGLDELKEDLNSLDPDTKDDVAIGETVARMNDRMGNIMQRLQVGLGVAEASTALFEYPVLQAADILLYKASLVPVGEDQEQHLELCREVAQRFNKRFGKVFPVARRIKSEAPRILGLDGKNKMSKSLGNHIGMLDSAQEISAKLKNAYTDPQRIRRSDPGRPEICNVFSIHGFFTEPDVRDELEQGCRKGTIGCFDCKKILAQSMDAELAPIRDRADYLRRHKGLVIDALDAGRKRCADIGSQTMEEVREAMGVGRSVFAALGKKVEKKQE